MNTMNPEEQQERGLCQTAYTWRKEQTSGNRVMYQSCGPAGAKAFRHTSLPAGGRETQWEGSGGLGLLNT